MIADVGFAPGTMNASGSGRSVTRSSILRSSRATIIEDTNETSGSSFFRSFGLHARSAPTTKAASPMAGTFGSVVTAMVTPFREDHALDLDRAQELASWLVGNGSDSVVVAGSTGESPTVTHNEKADLFRAVGEAITGTGKLICGTGTYSTAGTLALTRAAEDAGADGLLVATPSYNRPPQRGLIAHFEHVADATELPIIAYNIPGRTATRIEHDTLLRLAERPNIVAVKDSTGDFQGISRLISEAPDGFEAYSGD